MVISHFAVGQVLDDHEGGNDASIEPAQIERSHIGKRLIMDCLPLASVRAPINQPKLLIPSVVKRRSF